MPHNSIADEAREYRRIQNEVIIIDKFKQRIEDLENKVRELDGSLKTLQCVFSGFIGCLLVYLL
jgi:chromosome segregation ATPase